MLQSILDSATEVLWGRGTIALTLLCGFYFTVCTGFLPITRLTTVLQKTIGSVFSFHSDRENGKEFPPSLLSALLWAEPWEWETLSVWEQLCSWVAPVASSGCG